MGGYLCYLIFCSTFLTGIAIEFQLEWQWSNWQSWSSCSQTCGDAYESRTRNCPGAYCKGEEQETRICTNECVLKTPCSQVTLGDYDCNFESDCPNWMTTFVKGSSTPTLKTGPDYDHTFKHPGCGQFIYLESSDAASGQLLSTSMTTSSTSCLSFFVNFHSEDAYDMGILSVSIKPNLGNNLLLWERDGSYFSMYKEWLRVNINIPSGADFQIFFDGEKHHGYLSDLAIDDIHFTPNEMCKTPVDGNWSPWTSFDKCSVTCGCGTKNRKRYCNTPPRSDDGADCKGIKDEIIPCDEELPACPVKGDWADWSTWTSCSQDCGMEYQTRVQECTDPIPVGEDEENKCINVDNNGEMTYLISRMESHLCNHPQCGLDVWSDWTSWSLCTSTCKENKGTKVKSRTCPDDENISCIPENEDNLFENDEIVVRDCYGNIYCGYHWTSWTDWSDCSVTCEQQSGVRIRKQTCPDEDNVRCVPGADYIIKDNTQMQTENCIGPTTCEYNWMEWIPWSNCSVNCIEEEGIRIRKRLCPDESTDDCGGITLTEFNEYRNNTEIEYETCNGTTVCGYMWSDWTEWSQCSSTCMEYNGTKVRSRTCPDEDNISCVPENIENLFENDEIVIEVCNGNDTCGYHWTEWTDWSNCSVICQEDSGVRVRKQTCPDELDVSCAPNSTFYITDNTQIETEDCNGTDICGYHWTEWTDWSNCSVTCQEESGVRVRKQTCPDELDVSCAPNSTFYITGNTQIGTEDCNGTFACGF